jgi:hypothetical protein
VNGLLRPPPALLPGKEPWCQLNRRLDGPQSQSWLLGEEKNPLPLPRLEARSVQPTAQLLYWVRYPGYNFIGICRGTLHNIRILIYYAEGVPVFNITISTEDFGSWREKFTKYLMLWSLNGVSVLVLVQVVIDVVLLRGCWTVHVVIPIADSVQLVKHRAVGTEEAELLARGQTPVPDLQNRTSLFNSLVTSHCLKVGTQALS